MISICYKIMKDYPENRKKLSYQLTNFRTIGEPLIQIFLSKLIVEINIFALSLFYELNHIFVTFYTYFSE